MGSCISKCCPKTPLIRDSHHLVQDKLVISQASPSISTTPTTHLLPHHHHRPSSKKPALAIPNSPSPSSSSSSCTTTFTTSSYSTSSSTKSPPSSLSSPSFSSSTSISKDRSFSNEFLRSCARENPHLISSVDITKCSTLAAVPAKSNFNAAPKSRSPLKQRAQASALTSQKRARACSPNLTRQKSFRRSGEADNQRVLLLHQQPTSISTTTCISNSLNHSRRNLSSLSPSPSRRYSNISGDQAINKGISTKNNQRQDHDILEKGNFKRKAMNAAPLISERNKENRVSREDDLGRVLKRSIETCKHHIDIPGLIDRNSNIAGGGGVMSDKPLELMNSDHLLADDIDNPLISLDCFIFL